MNPICVQCERIMKPEKNGYFFEEGTEPGISAQPPDAATERTGLVPYKLRVGDLFKCPNCGHEVVASIPVDHIAEHYQPDYAENAKRYPPNIRVR